MGYIISIYLDRRFKFPKMENFTAKNPHDFSNPNYINFLKNTLKENGVICIPNLNLEPIDLEKILKLFGEPIHLPKALKFSGELDSTNYVIQVTNLDRKTGNVIPNHSAAEYWHSDGNFWFGDKRYVFNFLHSKIRPKIGGKTGFINSVAAYNSLSEELKFICQNIKIRVDPAKINDFKQSLDAEDPEVMGKFPTVYHDFVTEHKFSGKTCLYLSSHSSADFMWKDEELGRNDERFSKIDLVELKEEMWRHVEKPEFRYEHDYKEGDLLIWDNVLTMHRSMGGYGMNARKLYRGQSWITEF